jgi:Rps23 Pro-64 3,4-dihydroxylase Tpa1-like proline 4-hydroxylase
MDMWSSRTLHLKSDDGSCRGHVPSFDELSSSPSLKQQAYIRINDFLDTEVAEHAYTELIEDPRYIRVGEAAKTVDSPSYQLGILKSVNQSLSPNVQRCCDLLTGNAFRGWLSLLIGSPLRVVKPPSLFRMERGDRIERHDDISDQPLNRFSVVLHLSKNWKRNFGGNTVLGWVKRVEYARVSENGYLDRRWVFSRQRSVLTPTFNSLTVIALRPGMAHDVTDIRVKAYRVSIVGLYALKAENGDARIMPTRVLR